MNLLSNRFSTQTYGKWILAGEHAVLRGCPALVFPTKEFFMRFSFDPSDRPLSVHLIGECAQELELIFWGLLEKALQKVGGDRSQIQGLLTIENSLPLGAGLGASAALCVGLSRWLQSFHLLNEHEIYEFARELENFFHGESSGVDVAIAIAGRPLRFLRGGEKTHFDIRWQPHLYLSYSGQRGVTSECVKQVNELRRKNSRLGEKVDALMREAVELAEKSLTSDKYPIEQQRFQDLAHALDMARDAFYQWGLCEGPLDEHMKWVSSQGAYAVKPTGSGGGGYVLSLWAEAPPLPLQKKLIPLF